MIQGLIRRLTGRSRARVLYLHVGPHKTGTTSIQACLRRNAVRLSKEGYVYPVTPRADGIILRNHSPLANLGAPGAAPLGSDGPWRPIAELLARHDGPVVLSTELFAGAFRAPRALGRVVDLAERHGYRVEALAYVRDQPAWLNSWYAQIQKRLEASIGLRGFVDSAARRGLVDPWVYLKPYLDEPRVTLQVVSFERAIEAGLERDFLDRIGLPRPEDVPVIRHANPNPGAKTVFAAQRIMARSPVAPVRLPHHASPERAFRSAYEGLDWAARPYVGFDAATADAIRARYAEGNARLADRFFSATWRELAPAKTTERSVYDPRAATPAERREMRDVVEKVRALLGAETLSEAPAPQKARA
jgi:hypothetical protein